MKPVYKKFLKDKFNIDVDKYSKETLLEILDIIDKNILIQTKYVLEQNRVLEQKIDYYNSFINNE